MQTVINVVEVFGVHFLVLIPFLIIYRIAYEFSKSEVFIQRVFEAFWFIFLGILLDAIARGFGSSFSFLSLFFLIVSWFYIVHWDKRRKSQCSHDNIFYKKGYFVPLLKVCANCRIKLPLSSSDIKKKLKDLKDIDEKPIWINYFKTIGFFQITDPILFIVLLLWIFGEFFPTLDFGITKHPVLLCFLLVLGLIPRFVYFWQKFKKSKTK